MSLNFGYDFLHSLLTMGSWVYDSKKRILTLSPELINILGLPQDHTVVNTEEFLNHVHENDRDKTNEAFRNPPKDNIVVVEFRGFNRQNELRHYRAIGKVEYDGSGNQDRIFGATQDITDIKNTETQLRAREQELKLINAVLSGTLEATADGILLIDENGQEILANRKFYELWKIPEELRYQKDDHSLVTYVADQVIEPERFVERISKIYQDPVNDYFDTIFFKDGRVFERYSRPQIVDGKVAARVWSFRDVTESRKNFRDMMNALLKAEHASRVKSDFLANVSHEIRTPMTAILGYIDVVMENEQLKEDPQIASSLETIRRNGEHLLGIINDILDLSKIEAGKLDVNQTNFEFIPAMEDLIELFQVRAKSKNISLSMSADTQVPKYIQSDLLRIRQILINLIGNAIKFTEVGSIQIRISYDAAYSYGGNLSISVKDTGIGIKPDELQNLFKPFVQSDTSTSRKFGGTGLGLTISKHFAQMLNGTIEVQSEYEKGSEFTLRIPIRYDDPPQLIDFKTTYQTSSSKSDKKDQEDLSLKGMQLLLAEDGIDNRILISHVLQKAGATVTLASNGLEAIRETTQRGNLRAPTPFDLILMDMQMPEMDGYTATRELRNMGYSGPIIALTAHSMSGDREKCIQAGCDDYASKPINRVELLRLCIRLVNQWRAQNKVKESARE